MSLVVVLDIGEREPGDELLDAYDAARYAMETQLIAGDHDAFRVGDLYLSNAEILPHSALSKAEIKLRRPFPDNI